MNWLRSLVGYSTKSPDDDMTREFQKYTHRGILGEIDKVRQQQENDGKNVKSPDEKYQDEMQQKSKVIRDFSLDDKVVGDLLTEYKNELEKRGTEGIKSPDTWNFRYKTKIGGPNKGIDMIFDRFDIPCKVTYKHNPYGDTIVQCGRTKRGRDYVSETMA